MVALIIINATLALIFACCYSFQMAYLIIPLVKKLKKHPDAEPAREPRQKTQRGERL